MKKRLYLLLLPLLLAASCKKETQENPLDNVVRCKINGVPWESQCDGNIVFGCEAVDCQFSLSANKYFINLIAKRNTNGNDDVMFFRFNELEMLNEYLKVPNNSQVYSNGKNKENCIKYYLCSNKKSILNFVNIDSLNNSDRLGTIEGTFSFSCANICGDTIKITDGYFRTGYR